MAARNTLDMHQDDFTKLMSNSSNSVVVRKSYYVHEAPSDEEKIRVPKVLGISKPRKKYNIIFLKAYNDQKRTHRQINSTFPRQHEHKTLVYILYHEPETPKNMPINLGRSKMKITKPEVFFIKYGSNDTIGNAESIAKLPGIAIEGTSEKKPDQIKDLSTTETTTEMIEELDETTEFSRN